MINNFNNNMKNDEHDDILQKSYESILNQENNQINQFG